MSIGLAPAGELPSRANSILSSLNNYGKSRISFLRIRPVLICFFRRLYNRLKDVGAEIGFYIFCTVVLIIFSTTAELILLAPLFGLLTRDELPGYRVITLNRMSDPSGDKRRLTTRQEILMSEVDELKKNYPARVIESYRLRQSASTMDWEDAIKIQKKARNDVFDILMVWQLDRLSRAIQWDAIDFLLTLRKHNVILYVDEIGYIDWDDNDDAREVLTAVSDSKDERDQKVNSAIIEENSRLDSGQWPFGPVGLGLEKTDDDEPYVIDEYRPLLGELHPKFIELQDFTALHNYIKELANELGLPEPSRGQVIRAITNELYIGILQNRRTGEKRNEIDSTKVTTPETFSEAVRVYKELTDDEDDEEPVKENEFHGFVYGIILRMGQEYIADTCRGIRKCCPKCRSINIKESDTTLEYLGISLPKVHCDNCGYQGPIIRKFELQEMDGAIPFVCPNCQRTGHYETTEIDGRVEGELGDSDTLYEYKCSKCSEAIIRNRHPNAHKRGLTDPDNSVRIPDIGDSVDQNIPAENDGVDD